MNLEVRSNTKKDKQKPLSVSLMDDRDTTYSANSPTRSSFYREISSGGFDSFGQNDAMGQVMGCEAVITRDFLLYSGLIFFGFCLSVGLVLVYISKHEGFWMAVMCVLEAFCLYTWLIGYDAKKKLKAEIQQNFMSCLSVMIIIKAMVSILDFYSIVTWEEDEPEEVESDPDVQSRINSLDWTLVFSLIQLLTSGYVYYKGRKLNDLLSKRKSLIGADHITGTSNDLAVL